MNIVQLQEQLKNFSQDQLVREMQMPSGSTPQFLVLGEIMRRQKMQQDFTAQKAKSGSQSTVADDAIAAAGVPQGGIADMARALAPKTDMAQSTGVQAMASGGPVKKMQAGGFAKTDPAVIAMANRVGMSVDEYLRSVGAESAARIEEGSARRATRDRMLAMEPAAQGSGLPTQADLDQRYREPTAPMGKLYPSPNVDETFVAPPAFTDRAVNKSVPGGGYSLAPSALDAVRSEQESEKYTPSAWDKFSGWVKDTYVTPGYHAVPYEEGTVIDPASGAILSGGGVEGEIPAPEAPETEAEKFLRETKEKVAAAQAAAAKSEAAKTAAEATPAAETPTETPTPPAAETSTETPTAPATMTASTGGTGGAGAGGGGGGAGGVSSYEQELLNILGRREKASEQDKWLALAQVGLNMMSSTQPTVLGAIGEAGVKGVEAARTARDQYDKDRLELLGMLEQSRMARAAAAARAARGGGGGGGISPLQAAKLELEFMKYGLDVEKADWDLLYRLAPDGVEALAPGDQGFVDDLRAKIKSRIAGAGAVDPYAGRSHDVTGSPQ